MGVVYIVVVSSSSSVTLFSYRIICMACQLVCRSWDGVVICRLCVYGASDEVSSVDVEAVVVTDVVEASAAAAVVPHAVVVGSTSYNVVVVVVVDEDNIVVSVSRIEAGLVDDSIMESPAVLLVLLLFPIRPLIVSSICFENRKYDDDDADGNGDDALSSSNCDDSIRSSFSCSYSYSYVVVVIESVSRRNAHSCRLYRRYLSLNWRMAL